MKSFFVIGTVLCLIGCGDSSSGNGLISLKVINARGPAGLQKASPLPPLLVVESFMITISGEGIEPAIEQEIEGGSQAAEIDGIPAGHGRTILIEALNARGQVIRRREINGVVIEAGVISPIEANLNTVPIFSNVSEGNVISNGRLVLNGYGEPASQLEVIEEKTGEPLISADTSAAFISPSLNLGEFSFKPGPLTPGPHTFTVRDRETGESSKISVVLVSGQRPGRIIAAASGRLSLIGEPGGNFPQIVQHRKRRKK